jgi:pimeloyl-ACP methyl ester carboxylesterase
MRGMQVDQLEPVTLGGVRQWIRIRARDTSKPVLLLMQQGPGLPLINEVRTYDRVLGLENDYTVVYWDQRGTGLSSWPLRNGPGRFEISVAAMVDDTVELLTLLADRFGRKVYVAGFSFGATFAAYAAVRRPDLVETLVAVGMDVDMAFAEPHTYRFVLDAARSGHHRRAVRQLEAIGPPPHLTAKGLGTRARWAFNFGGVSRDVTYARFLRSLVTSLVRSPDYSAVDVVRTLRGITDSQSALLPELAHTDLVRDLPRLETPLVMVQGRHDQVAPGAPAERFFEAVSAPTKRWEWFEHSAHTPQLDEPVRFRRLLREVKASRQPSRSQATGRPVIRSG